MPDTVSAARSKGMRDLLPDEMDRLRAIESGFAAACRSWGYREVRTPVIEPLHLFTAAGTLSPQTLDRVYSFLDWDGWSGERVVLRPDSTIPTARMYAERLDGGQTAKLFYRQNVFRFTDDGSNREEWQCGVELIGDTGRAGDAEMALLALDVLRQLGVGPATVRLSHAGIVRAVLAAAGLAREEQSAAYDRLLDGDLQVVGDIEARLPQVDAPLRLLLEVEGGGSAFVDNVRSSLVGAIPALEAPLDELSTVARVLESQGVRPAISAVLARRFEYYSGMVIELTVSGERVGAGGRYDDLIAVIGGAGVPACGFALYVTPLLELMPAPSIAGTLRVLVEPEAEDAETLGATQALAARLRDAGVVAETVAGMHTSPARRVSVRAAQPRYRLDDGRELSEPGDVLNAIEGRP